MEGTYSRRSYETVGDGVVGDGVVKGSLAFGVGLNLKKQKNDVALGPLRRLGGCTVVEAFDIFQKRIQDRQDGGLTLTHNL